MKQKLLFFFLTALLCLTGGGELWATDYVLSGSTRTGYAQSQTTATYETEGKTITVTNDRSNTYDKYSSLTDYIKTAANSATHTIDLSNISSGEKVVSISFKGFNNTNNSETTSFISNVDGTGYEKEGTNQFLSRSLVATADDEDIKTFTVSGLSITCGTGASITFAVGGSETDLIITITTEENTIDKIYSGSYPYTWDFTVEDVKWTKSITQLTGLSWTKTESESQGEAYPSTRPYDSTYEIDIIKGLVFTTGSDHPERLKLDWYNKKLVLNGYVTIPNVSVGQTITFTSEGNVTANEYGTGRVSGGTGKVFTVTTAGNVQFTVNTSISSIAVTKGDIGNFRLEGKQGYSHDGLTERTSVYTFPYKAPETYTYNFKVSNTAGDNEIGLLYDATENSGGIEVNSTNFTLSSDNADVISVSNFSQAADDSKLRRIKWNNVTFGKPGEATVTFTFNGNDQFDSKTFTQKFTITKLEQVLTFAEASKSVNYVADETSTPQTVTKVVNQKYADGYRTNVTSTYPGTDVTYSSSNTNVATVNPTTGEITIKSAGETTITATAAETDIYESATASYTLRVNGTQNPTLAWTASNNFTYSGGVYSAEDLQYGNNKTYRALVSDDDGSGVTNSAIRYGLVEGYEGYLTIDDKKGVIAPTRKFADEDLDDKEVEVYAQIPASGSRNAARITYKVKIVKGLLADNFFKENELYVNVDHTIAPKNNLQSMRWEDIDAITVTLKSGSNSTAVPGTGESTVTDYKTATPKATYFDTKTATSGNDNGKEIVDGFYPIFKGLAEGIVTYTVTMSSKLYGNLSGDITLHVLDEETTTGFAWAVGTQEEYTIYEGDYMFLPEITGNTNGNFSYSSGYDNQNTHHKYVYTRRWNGSQYVTTYNNKNFHKGEGFPNFDLTSDAEGSTVVTSVDADNNVALLFWNTGTGTENDRLLIYGNKAGTVYLKASDPQITSRALSTIKIVVKSKTDINEDFENLKSSMTFPYTWDFTTDYDWSTEIATGTGNWIQDGSTYDLGMSSNFNYDYADEDKDEIVWGNDNTDPNTNSSELTDKLLVGKDDKVLRGFAGMKIRLGNNGTGSWYSKRDGIRILPYTSSNTPRLSVVTGTHTLILPTPTGENCPATFKVFVKAKARETGEGTLWVRNASLARDAGGQNKYHDFKSASAGDDIIYSVDATKGTPLELDLDKVDIYWIAYSTEAKSFAKFENTSYYATTYSYPKDLDMDKSLNDVNTTVQPYYASAFNSTDAVTMTAVSKSSHLAANTGVLLKSETDPGSCYMIAKPQNSTSVPEATSYATNYLKPNAEGDKVYGRDEENNKTRFVLAYRYFWVKADGTTDGVYKPCSDWSFVRAASTGATMSKNTAYLEVPGDIYVMMDVSNAARRAPEATSEDDTSEEDDGRPASKQLLRIVFEDEQPQTTEDPEPEDPATEEPEDGDSVIDKDRPRKPGDNGWPKPPFPPFPPIITDIDNVKTDDADNAVWHSMEGVCISQPTKPGLYIRNGKKIVIK